MIDRLREALMTVGFEPQNSSNWMSYKRKCIYCGGTESTNQNHAHMLVDEQDGLIYKCFRPNCDAINGKSVTEKELQLLGIYDLDIIKYVKKRNKNRNFSKHMQYGISSFNYIYTNNESTKYFKSRTGIILSKELVNKYKIVLDFDLFCKANDIENISKKEKNRFVNCIGYVDKTNTFIRFRDIKTKDKDLRFKAYKFRGGILDTSYEIGELDILSPEDQTVHIAEGFFDIVNIHNMYANDKDFCISSNTFASFKRIINDIFNQKPEVKIILYLDSDITDYNIKKMLTFIKYKIKNKILIRRNKSSKDFGDIRENIDMVEYQLEMNNKKKRY